MKVFVFKRKLVTYLPFGHQFPFMCQVVASVFPDNAFSPEYTTDSSITYPHNCDGDDVSYNEVDNVVTGNNVKRKIIRCVWQDYWSLLKTRG